MGATLDALHELQEIELQIIDIRQQLSRKEKAVAHQDKKLAELKKTLQTQRDLLLTAQREADRLDLDLKTRSAHVAKLREQLNTVRTNKEYAAVLSSLNTEKADASKLESSVLEKFEAIDKQKADFAGLEKSERDEIARLHDAHHQLDQTRKLFAERLAGLSARREAASAKLEPGIRKLFDRTSERYDGEAMAKIIRTHPRRDEFICEGCNMSVAADRYNAIITRDDVQTCPNCGRLLFVER